MATSMSREKQKQKYDLLFNYVKSIDSFGNSQEQEISKSALQKFYRSAALSDRQKNIDLNSQVYQLTIGSKKGKKKVKFSDQITVGNCQVQNKNSIFHRQFSNPQEIQRDLLQLQSTIFSTFKIKPQNNYNSTSINLSKIPYSQSLIIPTQHQEAKNRQKQNPIKIKLQQKVMRSQSQLLLTSRIKKKEEKPVLKYSNITSCKNIANSSKNPEIYRQFSSRTLDQRLSTKNRTLVTKRINSRLENSRNSSPLVRSESFWKQQTQLAVEIFKQKLSLKPPK